MPEHFNPDRAAALSWAIAEAQLDAREDGNEVELTTCIGPPWCLLEDEEAREEMRRGCLVCDKYRVFPDGSFVLDKCPSISGSGNS